VEAATRTNAVFCIRLVRQKLQIAVVDVKECPKGLTRP
jgi:hypothetical protein